MAENDAGNPFGRETYNLIQQTPMIHFQWNEPGVCLRASEVKPKLDRFLREQFTKEKIVINPQWCIGETSAFDYKMRFRATGKPVCSTAIEAELHKQKKGPEPSPNITICGSYFGNQGSSKSPTAIRESFKETIFYENPITMTIICLHKELSEEIKKRINLFFLTHNFGTRQTKGFGSFIVHHKETNGKSSTNRDPEKSNLETLKENTDAFVYLECSDDCQTKLNIAHTLYSLLKGGINLTSSIECVKKDDKDEFLRKLKDEQGIELNAKEKNYSLRKKIPGQSNVYFKSFLVEYLNKSNSNNHTIGWEKAKLKSSTKIRLKRPENRNRKVIDLTPNEPSVSAQTAYDEYVFIRALLGLPGDYLFNDIDKDDKVSVLHKVAAKETRIERFASPIVIKIFDNTIAFLPQEIPEEIWDKEFAFVTSLKSREKKRGYNALPTEKKNQAELIKTPKELNLIDLLNSFADYLNTDDMREALCNAAKSDDSQYDFGKLVNCYSTGDSPVLFLKHGSRA